MKFINNNPVFNKRFPLHEYFQIKNFYFQLLDFKKKRTDMYCFLHIQDIASNIKQNPNNFWDWWTYFYIPKKDGSQRIIYQPNNVLQTFFHNYLKLVQKIDETENYLIEHEVINKDFRNLYKYEVIQDCLKDTFILNKSYDIINNVSKNQNSYGFEKGRNISMNAAQHKDNQYFLKMDIQAAFPSIKKQSIFKILYFYERKLESLLVILKTLIYHWSRVDFKNELFRQQCLKKKLKKKAISICNSVANIITFNNCLVTGASMSPWILNKYLYSFDKSIYKYCKKRNLIYTRYADDLTISGHCEISKNTQLFINNMLKNWGMNENTKKTCFQSYKRKNVITGIVVSYDDKTKKGSLGIGYKRFNELKKNLYLMKQKKLTIEEENKTLGMLNFLRSVNIDRYNYLVEKYELV